MNNVNEFDESNDYNPVKDMTAEWADKILK